MPNVHIAITGIEKVVEKLEHVPPLFGLLTRSATGQAITTYFNMISRPGQPGDKNGIGGELDGPKAVSYTHLDVYKRQCLVRRFAAQADEQVGDRDFHRADFLAGAA